MTDDACTCERCGEPLEVGMFPFCPHGPSTMRVVPDSIPGGLYIETLDATVHSHSERRDLMRARGVHEQVRHVGIPGTDKSPHTTRWV